MYSKQETFNIVAKHLMSMTKPSIDTDDTCAYRGRDGARCAVGVLIPDEHYSGRMEGLGALSPSMAELLGLLGHDAELCEDLQLIHDDMFFFREIGLLSVAEKHGLRAPDWL